MIRGIMRHLFDLVIGMLAIAVEPFSVIKANQHLIVEHWEEVAGKDSTGRKLDVDWEAFDDLDSVGRLVSIVARDAGMVVGYAVFIIQSHFHAKNTLCAHNDALFLSPKYRKGRAGIMLIKESHKLLNDMYGKIMVMWHVKPATDFCNILSRLGCKKHETIYAIGLE